MESSEHNDNTVLIERISNGDIEAEGELWKRFRDGVHFLLLSKLHGRQEVVEDLEQEVFLAVQKALREGRLTKPERIGSYIHQTCMNLAARWWEREKRPLSLEHTIDPRTEVDPERIEIDREIRDRIHESVLSMRAIDRQIIALRYIREWSYSKIGEYLNLSAESARKRASRAIARLEILMAIEENETAMVTDQSKTEPIDEIDDGLTKDI